MRITLATLLALALPRAAAAGVVINEFLPVATGTDAGHEWVELYNSGPGSVDVSGWSIWRAKNTTTANWSERYVIPSGTLVPAEGFLVIGDWLVPDADLLTEDGVTLDLGNATSTGDAVRLQDGLGTIVDTVVYGPNNDQGFLDDTGSAATSIAPAPVADQSLARHTDGLDTDQSGADFVRLSPPTPGAPNAAGPGPGPDPDDCPVTAGRVVINELLPIASGTDAGQEWIELHNAGSGTADLSGWVVSRAKNASQGWGTRFTVPSGTTLAPGGYLLIADWLVPDADLYLEDGVTLDFGNAGTTGDAVRIEDCGGTVVDTVVYGPNNDHGFEEDDGQVATVLAPRPPADVSLARWQNGLDTDVSGDDFVLGDPPTTGAPNPVVEPPVCEPGAPGVVVLNELLPVAEGADKGQEWVELYNPGSQAVRLDDWSILRAKNASSGWGVRFTFPTDSWIEAGGHLLVADWMVDGADYYLEVEETLDMGNATSTGDGVRLDDCTGAIIDTVIYGPNNDHGFLEDSGEPATDIPPVPSAGQSLARIEDGYDTDVSGVDFIVQPDITPGASNPVTEPMVCTPSAGGLVINEVMTDPEGPDAGHEWFELYNPTDAPISIAGWYVSMASQPAHYGRADVLFPAGTTVQPGQWFVVGDEYVEEADLYAKMNIYNGGNGAAVRMYDCEDNVVDTVVYGSNNDNGLRDDNDEVGDPAVKPPAGQTLARIEDGVDTDSPADWTAATPTPGAANSSAINGDGSGRRGGGCNKRDTPGDRRGCSTVPLPMGGFELMLALVLLRRRRPHQGA